MQLDSLSLDARQLLPRLLTAAQASDEARRAADLLSTWDGRMDRSRPEPLIYAAWTVALTRRLLADELGPDFGDFARPDPRRLRAVLTDGQAWCDDKTTPETEDCDRQIAAALDDALASFRSGSAGTSSPGAGGRCTAPSWRTRSWATSRWSAISSASARRPTAATRRSTAASSRWPRASSSPMSRALRCASSSTSRHSTAPGPSPPPGSPAIPCRRTTAASPGAGATARFCGSRTIARRRPSALSFHPSSHRQPESRIKGGRPCRYRSKTSGPRPRPSKAKWSARLWCRPCGSRSCWAAGSR